MNKKLIVSLAAACVLSVSTAMAAANPFADVSPSDWAYSAVQKLAQAGIIDGYSDGTFKGNRTVTRYEMAQMIGKALYHEDKADAQQKAVIERLAAEYKDELTNLGVRVNNVEKSTDGVKDYKISTWIQSENTYGDTRGLKLREYDWEYRLAVEKQVSPKVHAMYQFRTYTGLDSQRWGYGPNSGVNDPTNMRAALTTRQAWVSYQADANTGFTFGKQVLWDGFIWDDFIRGLSINTKLGDNTNLVAATGRYDLSWGPYDSVNGYNQNAVINTASLSTKLGAGTIAAKWIVGSTDVNAEQGGNIVGGLASMPLGGGFDVQAGWAKNTRVSDHNKLIKYQLHTKSGITDLFLQHWQQDSQLHAPIENGDHMAWWSDMYGNHDIKGWRFITDTPVDKNFDLSLWYGDYKLADTDTKAKKYGCDITYSF
jgi:chromosome segregation and condensation protein ScpB